MVWGYSPAQLAAKRSTLLNIQEGVIMGCDRQDLKHVEAGLVDQTRNKKCYKFPRLAGQKYIL